MLEVKETATIDEKIEKLVKMMAYKMFEQVTNLSHNLCYTKTVKESDGTFTCDIQKTENFAEMNQCLKELLEIMSMPANMAVLRIRDTKHDECIYKYIQDIKTSYEMFYRADEQNIGDLMKALNGKKNSRTLMERAVGVLIDQAASQAAAFTELGNAMTRVMELQEN